MRAQVRGGAADRGQTTILLVGVLVLLAVMAVGLGRYGEAVAHRIRARTAADAIALATASDSEAGAELSQWYESQQVVTAQDGPQTLARSGPSAAAAWASGVTRGPTSAPAITAIIGRAEQLRGGQIRSARWGDIWIEVSGVDAELLLPVAAELGLCEVVTAPGDGDWTRVELC